MSGQPSADREAGPLPVPELSADAHQSLVPIPPDPGRGWYPHDLMLHLRDAPRHCPNCAAPLQLADGGRGIATEYWRGTDRVFVCFCGSCFWSGDIVLSERVIGHEPEH
jgi:hypothetical protein